MGALSFIPSYLAAVGVEVPHCTGATMVPRMHLYYRDHCILKTVLKPDQLTPVHRLKPEERALLERDQRKRGEHRPRRLTLGRPDRFPYHFYSVYLPGPGLLLADADPWPRLRLELWLEKYDPLAYPVLVHVRGRVPTHFPDRVRWRLQPEWTLAERLRPLTAHYDETPCCHGARVQVYFGKDRLAVA